MLHQKVDRLLIAGFIVLFFAVLGSIINIINLLRVIISINYASPFLLNNGIVDSMKGLQEGLGIAFVILLIYYYLKGKINRNSIRLGMFLKDTII